MRPVIKTKIMKIFFPLLILFNIWMYSQDNVLYVMIDKKYDSIFKFNKENNYSSIKILKNKYIKIGFANKSKSNVLNQDIVVVKNQPVEKRYYEFGAYEMPKIVNNVKKLKT